MPSQKPPTGTGSADGGLQSNCFCCAEYRSEHKNQSLLPLLTPNPPLQYLNEDPPSGFPHLTDVNHQTGSGEQKDHLPYVCETQVEERSPAQELERRRTNDEDE